MKIIASLALAGIVAATSLATGGTSIAGGWNDNSVTVGYPGGYDRDWRYHGRGRDHDHWDHGGALFGGLALGYALGTFAAPPPAYYPPPPPYAYQTAADAHIEWCSESYTTYNPETNLWVDFKGVRHTCVGPY